MKILLSISAKAIQKSLLGALVAITVLGQASGIVLAASTEIPACSKDLPVIDCNSLRGDWTGWVPDICNQSQDTGSAGQSGDDSLQQIFNYLATHGFTKEQAAGITGNIKVESHADPRIYEADQKDYDIPPGPAGWGIVQWTPPQPKIVAWAQSNGRKPSDLTAQLDYLIAQLNGSTNISNEKSAGDQIKAVNSGIVVNGVTRSTAWHAAQVFLMAYERAADHAPEGQNASIRGSWADQILASWGASVPSSPITATTPSGCANTGGSATAGSGFLGDPGVAAVLAANAGNNGSPPVAQCVGYVKYELGIHFPPYKGGALGNGIDVASNLGKNFGVAVNTTPAVHAVFSMPVGLFGHTGIVAAVTLNGDGSLQSFTVEEYNWIPGAYDTRTLDASYITQHSMTFAHTEAGWK